MPQIPPEQEDVVRPGSALPPLPEIIPELGIIALRTNYETKQGKALEWVEDERESVMIRGKTFLLGRIVKNSDQQVCGGSLESERFVLIGRVKTGSLPEPLRTKMLKGADMKIPGTDRLAPSYAIFSEADGFGFRIVRPD